MKRKKTLKGVTLMEVIISVAVYAVIALLLAEIMGCVNKVMDFTNKLNRRLETEATVADNQSMSGSFHANEVRVVAHINNGSGIVLEDNSPATPAAQKIYEYVPFDANDKLSDDENSTHFRYMNFQHSFANPSGLNEDVFIVNIMKDGTKSEIFNQTAFQHVTRIDRIVVKTVGNFLYDVYGADPDALTDTITIPRAFIDWDNPANPLIEFKMCYAKNVSVVPLTIEFYPEYESSFKVSDASKSRPNITISVNALQFYSTSGTEVKWYRYSNADFTFDGDDGQPVKNCSIAERFDGDGFTPTPATPGT